MCERLTFADLGEDVLNIIISMVSYITHHHETFFERNPGID